ncbi:hypothetical protein [Azospirillum sp. sgz302134]
MKPNPISVAAALLLTACATEFRDETPGQAQSLPPVRTQTYTPGGAPPSASGAGLKTWRQLQEEANARPSPSAQAPSQRMSQLQEQGQRQPPVRRRGSSSPPPAPAEQMAVPSLPPPPSTQAQTDRFKYDLMSPEVDRLRTEDAMGRLEPLQQRELFRKEQDLRQYGTGPRGF